MLGNRPKNNPEAYLNHMPVILCDPQAALQQKLKFLEIHPFSQLTEAKSALQQAQSTWNNYAKEHENYAKIAKTISVLRSDKFTKAHRALKQATQKVAD